MKQAGSGYLLTDRLVLTSYHGVRGLPRGERVEVRPLEVPQRTGWLAATLSWPHEAVDLEAFPEHDAALLVIDDPPGGPGSLVGAVRFGQVAGHDRIPCKGLGFPNAEKHPGNRRDTMPVRGHIDALQARKSGLLTVHVDEGIVPRRQSSGSGWAGASGTALFCESLLVGVLATDRNIADDASVLRAVPITALAGLPGFRDALAAHGLDLQLEQASPAAQQLSAYLTAAYYAATRHPYAGVLPGTTPPLAAVYLRQQIRRIETQAPGPGAPIAAEAVPADDILTDPPPTCVIISGPGGGKSSLLRTRLGDGVKRWQNGHHEELLPVLVHAAELAEHTLTDALMVAASDGLPAPLPQALFRFPPRPGGRWLVLLDGLDEVPDPAHRKNILHKVAVATTGEHAHLYRFVIATRPLPDKELDALGEGVRRYDLEPFAHGELETVARAWFRAFPLPDPAGTAQRFAQELHRGRLADLARVPLMAAMLCQLHAATIDQGMSGPPLPSSRGQIYRDFIALLRKSQPIAHTARYPGLERHPEAHAGAETVLASLQDLIARLAAQRQTGNDLPALTIIQAQPEAACPEDVREEDWRTFLEASLRRSGLLTARGGDLVFLHQTLQEHLAARHLMRDPRTRRKTLRDVFHQPRRYGPGLPEEALPLVRVWGWRYWAPPAADASYVGFLLDAAHREGLTAGNRYLHRLTRAGFPGLQAIVTLHELRTTISEAIIRTAGNHLASVALDTSLQSTHRGWAVEMLVELGDGRGAGVLHDSARDTTLDDGHRVWAAGMLARLGDDRGADLLQELARDTTLDGIFRVSAVVRLVGLGDDRGADLLQDLARDTTLGDVPRAEAGRILVELGDDRGADLLQDLARDTTLGDFTRVDMAVRLIELGDDRGSDLLQDLALGTTLDDDHRVWAVVRLVELGDDRGADLLHDLARDTTLDGIRRVEAGRRLAKLGDDRGADLLHDLARDTTLDGIRRVEAGRRLAKLGDDRGADLLHDLARDTTLDGIRRMWAAELLVEFGDDRGADLLQDLALDTTLDDVPRVEAGRRLVGLGDDRSAGVLHDLARDTTLLDIRRMWAARKLVGLGDDRSAGVLHDLAR
ncbi:hypothetical protein, partial [Kitasatospora arboriphila]|uniref:NACHT domain-containing protein n=1 Tax=Kitasatospora arboriphila TaxID=258052 RepID=UPI0031D8A914